jgi:hypothetical protein
MQELPQMITNSDGINDDEEFKTDFNYENL